MIETCLLQAGFAGLVAALTATTVNAKVTLVEKHKMEEDCLNTGCVPSNAFIKSAKAEERLTLSSKYLPFLVKIQYSESQSIVADHVDELITDYISAMKHDFGMNKILKTIHIYPTLSKANKFAAGIWKKANAPGFLPTFVKKYHERSLNNYIIDINVIKITYRYYKDFQIVST